MLLLSVLHKFDWSICLEVAFRTFSYSQGDSATLLDRFCDRSFQFLLTRITFKRCTFLVNFSKKAVTAVVKTFIGVNPN